MAPPFGLWQLIRSRRRGSREIPTGRTQGVPMTFAFPVPLDLVAARTFGLLALALTLFGLGGACEDKHVGRPCELGTVPLGGTSGQIATVVVARAGVPEPHLLAARRREDRSAAQTAAGASGTARRARPTARRTPTARTARRATRTTRPTSAAAAGSSAAGRRPSAPSPARSSASARLRQRAARRPEEAERLRRLTARRSTRVNSLRRRSGCGRRRAARPSSQNVTATTSKRYPSAAGVSASR